MRRERAGVFRPRLAALAVLGAVIGFAEPARAQVPQPRIPDINQRSGLLSRFAPFPRTNLPHDPDRDYNWGTRVGDNPYPKHPNSPIGGGMYGYPLSHKCTVSVPGFFNGAPGKADYCPDCKPKHPSGRIFRAMLHQNKPKGSYYAGGSYVPIYDYDFWVPGAGPDLWPHYIVGNRGG